MSDPFASLDPIQKPKTAAERVLTAPVYNHPPPGAPVTYGGGGMGMDMGMHMGMSAMAPPGMGMMGMAPNMVMSGNSNNMGMGGNGMMNMGMAPPGMGMGMAPLGMGMGMNPSGMGGMNMGQQNPFQQQQQQQQQPVMYDNIKNLLQQKPKAPAAFEDSASMDFLDNLGGSTTSSSNAKTNSGSFPVSNPQVRAAEPTSAAADPFGGGFGASSPVSPSMSSGGGDMGLSIFETGTTAASPSSSVGSSSGSGGTKSSALADRLANGRRKTQEMQRSQLQLNANSFGAGGQAVPKISLKEMAGQSSSSSVSSGMSLDDFSSIGSSSSATTTQKLNSFGDSDPFGGGGTGSSSAPRQSSFGGGAHDSDSDSKPVDENDSTFW